MKKEKCVGRNCNHIFPIEDVTNNMNENDATWNEWAGDGFLCGKCSIYLSIAEDISDAMSNQDMDIDMEYCVDSAYMLIDTYNCYKKIEEEENERRRKKMDKKDINKMVRWAVDTDIYRFAKEIYQRDEPDEYTRGKFYDMQTKFIHWVADLDYKNRQRLADAINKMEEE